jgi:hypothetical protein
LKKQIAMRIRRNILQEKIEQIRQDNRMRKINSELNLHKILSKLSSSGTEYDKENEN